MQLSRTPSVPRPRGSLAHFTGPTMVLWVETSTAKVPFVVLVAACANAVGKSRRKIIIMEPKSDRREDGFIL